MRPGLRYYKFKKKRARAKYYFYKFINLRNKAREKKVKYEPPNMLVILFKCLPYLIRGYEVIGIWHTHLSGDGRISKYDKEVIKRFLARDRKKLYAMLIKSYLEKDPKMVFAIETNQVMNFWYIASGKDIDEQVGGINKMIEEKQLDKKIK